ncbi:NAD(P)/FAD-dependent oxidoreductase [Haloarcula brevis]|uniref:NAD(P)/FAD-dependent oxidoreductase n=1 Tax=Haloarcula brevis TaxID=3111453 RepID=UPI00300EA140
MTRVGVVGAGAGAAALTHVLDRTTDAEVTVLEKSGGLCGRAATRRHGDLTYDYGANYLKSDDGRVNDLVSEVLGTDGLVDVTEPVYTFDRDGAVSPGRAADEHKWSYGAGLTQVAKRLFGGTDATVHRRTRVESIARDDGSWTLTDTDGTEWGPFDALVLNPPAPQTAALLRSTDWHDDRRDALLAAVEAVDYRAVYTAVLHYEFELDRPYYALVNTDKEHDVGWIAREECKAGHVPDGQSLLVVQSVHDWAIEHYDDDATENVAALAGMTADIIGDDRLAEPAWSDHQGWRYALPEGGVASGPVDSAEDAGLYCVGDWVPGEGRLHAAIRCGLDAGERMAYAL